MPKLILTTEAQGKVVYEFAERSITIGRAPDNGTKVNGVPITQTTLRFEDRIRFGAIEARFEPDVRGSQPLPQRETIEAKLAESSAAPSGFGNASPFRQRSTSRDSERLIVFGIAAVAVLTFLGSMIAVLAMRAP